MSQTSSTGSIIHVAGSPYGADDDETSSGTHSNTPMTPEKEQDQHSIISEHEDSSVKARVKHDGVLIISGLEMPPHTSNNRAPSIAQESDEEKTHDMSDAEPNERGLYSKAYILRHPETRWVHRGQGLYLPQSKVVQLQREHTPSKRSADEGSLHDQESLRSSKRQRSTYREASTQSRTQSPSDSREQDSLGTYGLRDRYTAYRPSAAEKRDARMFRRAQPDVPTLVVDVAEAHDESDPWKTYTKAHVTAHPEKRFKHVGNGFYRQLLTQSNGSQLSRGSRRSSDHSLTASEHSAMGQLYTIHESDARRLPIERSARRKISYHEDSAEASLTSSDESSASSQSEDEQHSAHAAQSYSKAEMLAYKQEHPDAIFLHRGNGRYKRADGVTSDPRQQPMVNGSHDRVTYSKSYVQVHPEMQFFHCGGGRYKISKNDSSQTSSSTNGSLGRRDGAQSMTLQIEPASLDTQDIRLSSGHDRPDTTNASRTDRDTLYDRDYVDSHPDETFHHRGQGRWARGLPPAGSSSKMAVRGPGVRLIKSLSNSSSGSILEQVPKPGVLFRKDEGPQKWPNLDWTYRGGGKWVLSTKHARVKQAAQTTSQLESSHIVPDQYELESNASTSRRGSDAPRPRIKRTRSILQSIEADEEDDLIIRSPSPHTAGQMLTLDEDKLTDADLPQLYLDRWSQLGPDDTDDEAALYTRAHYQPLNDPELFIQSMTKHNPSVRPTETLYRLAEHMQQALSLMQDEYLELDKITAPHARIPRKMATGGRLPSDVLVSEDRKEADLYNYAFDPKKVGYQDPVAQRIIIDTDARGLRKRRKRNEIDADAGAQLSEEPPLGRRVTKPVQRFDGNPAPQSRRPRSVLGRGSATPDPVVTPEKRVLDPDNYIAPSSGRWANHIPKRIRELRGASAGPGKAVDGAADSEKATDGSEDSSVTESLRKRNNRLLLGGPATAYLPLDPVGPSRDVVMTDIRI